MPRYIDADLFKAELNMGHCTGDITGPNDVEKLLDLQPAADVREVRRGYWIRFSGDEFCCSNCGKVKHYYTLEGVDPDDFCPTCGADMREVE